MTTLQLLMVFIMLLLLVASLDGSPNASIFDNPLQLFPVFHKVFFNTSYAELDKELASCKKKIEALERELDCLYKILLLSQRHNL